MGPLEADCSPTNLARASDWADEHGLNHLAYTFLWMAAYKKYPEVYKRPGFWHWGLGDWIRLPGHNVSTSHFWYLNNTYFKSFRSCIDELYYALIDINVSDRPSHQDLTRLLNSPPGAA